MPRSRVLEVLGRELGSGVLTPFLVSRLSILAAGLLAIAFGRMHAEEWHVSSEAWIDMWARWDSGFYLDIAADGYTYAQGQMSSVAFFPMYPFLLRTLALGSQNRQLLTVVGWLVSSVATLLAFHLLYRLTSLDYGREVGRRTVWYLAFFPTSFFLGMVYTEGLFLLLTVAAFYSARQRCWVVAGILGGLSAATRPIGVLLVLPLAYEWHRQGPRRWLSAWPLLLIPLGLVSYMLYLSFAFDSPLRFVQAQTAWGRAASVGEMLQRAQDLLSDPQVLARASRIGLELVFVVIGVVLLIRLLRDQRPSYALYALYTIGLPLATLQVLSMPRFLIVAFPLFIALAEWLDRKSIFSLVVMVSGLAQTILVARWSLWYWVA